MKSRSAALLLVCGLLFASPFHVRADEFVEGEVLVTFKPRVVTEGARTALGRHSMTMAEHYRRISARRQRVAGLVRHKERTTAQLIEELKSDADVETVEPNFIRHIAAVVPNASNTGAMADSGDHGTHVAGTIAAVGRNGAGMIGVQYRAKILPLKISADGESMLTSAVLAALDYAIDLRQRGVNLVAINASFGGTSRSTSAYPARDPNFCAKTHQCHECRRGRSHRL